jgi:hypothetical protein
VYVGLMHVTLRIAMRCSMTPRSCSQNYENLIFDRDPNDDTRAHKMKTRTPAPTPVSNKRRKKSTTTMSHADVNAHMNTPLKEEHHDESDNPSIGSVDTLDSLQRFQQHQQAQWPWNNYLPERYALPKHDRDQHDHHEQHESDDQCEFCGPLPPTNASYLKDYHIHLPSLLE